MQVLNLPSYPYQLRKQANKLYILDFIRKKYVRLTPEEWVRQHLLHYLVQQREFPKGRMRVEGSLPQNHASRQRADILLLGPNGQALLLAECKAPQVTLDQKTLLQASRYNLHLQVPYLLISNGLMHFCCQLDYAAKKYTFLPSIPHYQALKAAQGLLT